MNQLTLPLPVLFDAIATARSTLANTFTASTPERARP